MGEVQRSAPSLKTEYLYPGVKAITNQFTDKLTNNWMGSLFGENDDFGQAMGNIFSNGITSVSDTFTKNLVKGDSLTAGLGKNVGTTLGGVGAGITGNLLGKGITSLGGNTALSRGLGLGVSTAVGSLGGSVLSNIIQGKNAFQGFRVTKDAIAAKNALSAASNVDKMGAAAKASKLAAANLAGLGMSVVGSGLQAAFGPSKEYGGRYGNITLNMDTAYDLINAGASFVPGVGTVISGAMTLNKGLSNIFGSTDGMTRTDAILGSAFMPAPVKWINMWGSSKTGTFNDLSWQNTERANSFMGNAFGNLNDRFKRAREEAGKTYGTFSQGAKRRALDNIDFANKAWALIMNMADENELAKIRSLYMTSINNQRYALNIQGGFSPVAFGKMGMKLLNNSISHEVGLRLLSGAALINSGLQILSAQGGTKVPKKLAPFEIIGDGQLDPTLAYHNFTINSKPAKLLSANYNTNMGRVQYEDGSEEEIRLAPNFWLNPKSSDSKKIPMLDTFREGITNLAANEKADEFANRTSLTPERFVGLMAANVPLAAGALGTVVTAPAVGNAIMKGVVNPVSDYIGGTVAGQLATKTLSNPYVDAGLKSVFAGHGLNHWINEGIDGWGDAAMTALEITPLGRLAKPMYKRIVQPGMRFLNSPYTGKWTQFGNKEYRFKPGYLGMNSTPVESRPKMIRLYRASGTNGNFEASRDGGLEFAGQWFTDDPTKPQRYASMTVKRAKRAGVDNPLELQYIDIPESELNKYRASEILKGRTDIEYEPTEDFLIPLDYPRQRVPLEGYTGNYLQDARRPLPELDKPITSENAANITPEQWTAAQDAAIARGDMAEAQRLADLHSDMAAKKLGFNVYDTYHGQAFKDETYRSKGYNPYSDARTRSGYYSVPSIDVARTYNQEKGAPVFALHTYFKKPFITDAKGNSWQQVPMYNLKGEVFRTTTTDKLANQAFSHGLDGVIVKNVDDIANGSDLSRSLAITDDYISAAGRNKLRDAVTYDDMGKRIGLGDRHNFNINDTRYSWLPWFLGGTSAATLYNQNK